MATRLLVLASGLVGLQAAMLPAQAPAHTFHGLAPDDRFGGSVAGAGDVDADGYDDFIVGAVLHDGNGTNAGMARVYSGFDGSVLFTFHGNAALDQFGQSVDGAGDVNGDGHADVFVGAMLSDANGQNSGMARVFSGMDGAVLYTFLGDAPDDRLGRTVSAAGDVNGDGWDDVITGAYLSDANGTDAGLARVYSGRDGSVLHNFHGDSAGDHFGAFVSGVGDVNGDGFDDVAVGAPLDDNNGTDSGSVRVFSGLGGTILFTLDGDAAGDHLSRVAGPGDVNYDGQPDVLVGAWGWNNNRGMARVYSGADGSELYTVFGDGGPDGFGRSVGDAGDVNGDGVGDLIVGARDDDTNGTDAGSVRVLDGIDGSVLYTYFGDSAGDRMGQAVASAGDINDDGFADVIIGANLTDTAGTNAGSAFVYMLAPYAGESLDRSFWGSTRGQDLGESVAIAGDVNGDGHPDVIVGSNTGAFVYSGPDGVLLHAFPGVGPVVDGAGDVDNDGHADLIVGTPLAAPNATGMAQVFSGRTGALMFTFNGVAPDDQMGYAVAGPGDLTGDGHADLLVGVPGDDVNNDAGSVRFYSGATGVAYQVLNGTIAFGRFGRAVSGAGDVDNDGWTDVILGGRDQARVHSTGRLSLLLHTLQGPRGSQFGSAVADVGDINNDSYDDVVVGAPGHTSRDGQAVVFSGFDASVLHVFSGTGGERLGQAVAGAGDVNADGYRDVAVGNRDGVGGHVSVFSGFDGSRLDLVFGGELVSTLSSMRFGISVDGGSDTDGDGVPNLIVGAPSARAVSGGNPVGAAFLLSSLFRSDGSKLRIFGPACPGTSGNLPRIEHAGRAVLGGSFDATLRAVPPFAPSIVVIGLVPQSLPLAGFGMPGCTGLTQPLTTVFTIADTSGRASFTQPVPNVTGLLGLPPRFQWFVFDPGANTIGLIASNGLLAVVGNP